MARTQNERAQFYSLAAVSVTTLDNAPVGQVQVTAGLDLSGVVPENITTRGGFSDFPTDSRAGIRTGEAKLTMNECPAWLERIANGGAFETSPVSSTTPSAVSVSGSSLNSLALTVGADAAAGIYYFTAGTSGAIEVDAHTEQGRFTQSIGSAVYTAGDTAITGTGVTLDQASGVTPTDGDSVLFRVYPTFTGADHIVFPAEGQHDEYKIQAYSVTRRSPQDALMEVRLNRVAFRGLAFKLEDNTAPNGVEVTLQMLTPRNGDPVWELLHIGV